MAALAPYLGAIEIVLAIVMTVLVVLQSKGSDLSALTGGSGERYGTRRGAEALMHQVTIGTAVLFFVVTVLTFVAMGQ